MVVPKPRRVSSGKWFIQMRLGGESITVTDRTEKACIRAAQLVKAEYLAGKRAAVEPDPDPEPAPVTLTAAIDKYITARSNVLSPATIRGYRTIQKHRFSALMKKPVTEISRDAAQIAVNQERNLCSSKTLLNAWRFVSGVIAEETGIRLEIRLPQLVRNERAFLMPEQIDTFVEAVHGTAFEIPALLALCSLRQSEILGLRWEDVDLDAGSVRVNGATVPNEHHRFVRKDTAKNLSSIRTVPIMPQLVEALKAAQRSGDLVTTMSASWMFKGINNICEANGLPQVGVHGLRHSFASLAYHLGMPEKIAMEIGGWSDDATMRKIYTHIAEIDRKNSVNAMQEYYRNLNNANKNANQAEKGA